jgi:hypothetical protein
MKVYSDETALGFTLLFLTEGQSQQIEHIPIMHAVPNTERAMSEQQ